MRLGTSTQTNTRDTRYLRCTKTRNYSATLKCERTIVLALYFAVVWKIVTEICSLLTFAHPTTHPLSRSNLVRMCIASCRRIASPSTFRVFVSTDAHACTCFPKCVHCARRDCGSGALFNCTSSSSINIFSNKRPKSTQYRAHAIFKSRRPALWWLEQNTRFRHCHVYATAVYVPDIHSLFRFFMIY